jgi:DNA polymerase
MPAFPDPERRHPLAEDCTRCPALVDARECISWGVGPPSADLLVVGEAPGAGDPAADRWKGGNWTGMAYTSRHSGRRIRDLLADVGFGPDRSYFTNAVKCFPADGAGSNREPTPEERANCRPYLRREVDAVDPAAVVPTGKHATRSVFALDDRTVGGFLDGVLEPVALAALDTTAVPLLHPSYQDVWVQRLGHDADSYRRAIAETLAAVVDGEPAR